MLSSTDDRGDGARCPAADDVDGVVPEVLLGPAPDPAGTAALLLLLPRAKPGEEAPPVDLLEPLAPLIDLVEGGREGDEFERLDLAFDC